MITAGIQVAAERADYPGFITPLGSVPTAWSRTTEAGAPDPAGRNTAASAGSPATIRAGLHRPATGFRPRHNR
jgi:hypothetical protein